MHTAIRLQDLEKSPMVNEHTWQNVHVGTQGNHAQNLAHTVQSEQFWFEVFVPQIVIAFSCVCSWKMSFITIDMHKISVLKTVAIIAWNPYVIPKCAVSCLDFE